MITPNGLARLGMVSATVGGPCAASALPCSLLLSADAQVTVRFDLIVQRQWWFWSLIALGTAMTAGVIYASVQRYQNDHPALPPGAPIDLRCKFPELYTCP